MRLKARLTVSLAAFAVATYGFGPLPHGNVPVAASGTVTYSFDKNPIAPAGTLTAASTVSVTLTASDNSGPLPGATVYLAFDTGGDSGSAVAAVTQCTGHATLSTTAVPCTADQSGNINVTYKVPTTSIPTGGHDTITAGATGSTVDASTAYYYSTVAAYVFSAMPLAAEGSVTASTHIPFTITLEDSHGAAVTSLPNGASIKVHATLSSPATAVLYFTSDCSGSNTNLNTTTIGPPDAQGKVALCLAAPTSPTEVDTITAADTAGTADVSATDGYNANKPSGLSVAPSPIASAGTLSSGAPVTVTYTFAPPLGQSAISMEWVELNLVLQDAPAGTTAFGTASVGGTPLTTTAQTFAADSNGRVTVGYVAGSSNTGADEVIGSGPNVTTIDDFYTYAQVTHYVLSPNPIAAAASVANQTPVSITVTPEDASNTPVPNAVVKVAFKAAAGDGGATQAVATLTDSKSAAVTTGTTYTTGSSGVLPTFAYKSGKNIPGGEDVITASSSDGSNATTDVYKYDLLTSYTATPTPIAGLGTLGPNATKNIDIVQKDGNTPNTATPMWLTFNTAHGGGTASASQCTSGTLSTTPTECTPDNSGTVVVTYTAPSTLPGGGGDVLTIGDDSASPAVTAQDSYAFVGTYAFSPSPIASVGSLAPGSTTPVTVTVKDAQGSAAPNAAVYLSMASASGGATASVTGLALTSTPQQFIADGSGNVTIQYTVANPPAGGGTDTLTAQNAQSSPSVTSTDTYGYVSSYTFTPAAPIAPAASLGANALRQVTVTANGPTGSPAPHAVTYVSFTHASGGGGATVGGVALTSTPMQVRTNGSGQIVIDYTTPASLPASGSDTVTVGNGISNPTLSASDSYSFARPVTQGYWMVAKDGGIFSFGLAQFYGSTGAMTLNKPIVGMASTPDHAGYWLVASDGGIFTFGDAGFHGSTGSMTLNKPIVGMAATPSGNGYWLVASDGGIFTFGDAGFHGSTGSMTLNKPIVGMAATPSGNGYWLVASDGGIFSFGDAGFHGSTGSMTLNKPIVGMAATHDGHGYWLVASDGGIFTFGDAGFHGSTGAIHLNEPIVGMAPTQGDGGYWLVASDGGIFAFDDAGFYGSEGGTTLNQPIVGMAGVG